MDNDTVELIKNMLRQGTITWSGRAECLNRGRRQRPNGLTKKDKKEKFLWERQCDDCKKWYLLKDKLLEVDHIEEVGPFKGDWNDFIARMFCDQSNLQALCQVCHLRKTSKYNASLIRQRKVFNMTEALDRL